ncbi:MAG: alanine racemase [Gammaproteobacteria bacterium]|nr:alanine racemase [Gammaproteobacteria bacterium]NNJ79593.1 DSD1 family PLP-dependent enzyme [Xanthomonadales bacterium]
MARRLAELNTPCLVLDRRRMQSNIKRMAQRAASLGVALRPHLKTCKSLEIGAYLAPGKKRVTVSTLREAEYFADGGFRDILYAVSIAPARLPAVARLNAAGARVQVLLDNPEAVRQLALSAADLGCGFEAWIEVDVDGHRAGLEPEDPQLVELGRGLQSASGIELRGVMTHAGGSYNCRNMAELEAHAEQERQRCVAAAGRLRAAGIRCPGVSVGSTPTALAAARLDGVTELRAGVYVFFDLFQAGLGVCRVEDIALSVLTTVISHKKSHRRLIIDAGGLALSKDRSTAGQALDCGYGLVARAADGRVISGLSVSKVNQEHGMIELAHVSDFDAYPVGSQLRILPNHACMTAAAYEGYSVLDSDDRVVERWSRCSGW